MQDPASELDSELEPTETPDCPIVMIGNQKGGVGKSTNTINLAAALGQEDKRVLLIDTDGEASSTRGLGVDPNDFVGFYEICAGLKPIRETVIDESLPENVHLIASRPDVSLLPKTEGFPADNPDFVYSLLREPLDDIRRDYDYILLDTPPGTGNFQALSCYAVADFLILSVKPDAFSFTAMIEALNRMAGPIKESVNPKLDLLGVLVCDVVSNSLDWFRDVYAPLVSMESGYMMFNHRIRHHSFVTNCARQGRSVFQDPRWHWKKNMGVVGDFRRVAREIIERIERFDDYFDGKLSDVKGLPADWQQMIPRPDKTADQPQPVEVTDAR